MLFLKCEVGVNNSICRDAEREASSKTDKLLDLSGSKSVDYFHRNLGKCMWDKCGMSRHATSLSKAFTQIEQINDEFWKNGLVSGAGNNLNQSLEKAGRVSDFLEFSNLVVQDALDRKESCGSHFREEHQTNENEALRNDKEYSYVSVWEHSSSKEPAKLHKEDLVFETVKPQVRSYK